MIRIVHSESGSWFFYPSRIPGPGVKKAPDPESATLIKVTNFTKIFKNMKADFEKKRVKTEWQQNLRDQSADPYELPFRICTGIIF